MNEPDRIRFRSKVSKTEGCWFWTGAPTIAGYGVFCLNGRQELAHRASWMFAFGKIPAGLNVCHACDAPACVNPSHLFLGSYAANALDMLRKGRGNAPRGDDHWSRRHPERVARGDRAGGSKMRGELHHSYLKPETVARGEDVGGAKLTTESVLEIRSLRGTASSSVLAKRFGVSRTTIKEVWSGKTWRHV